MLEVLEPFSKKKGGVLEIKHITYTEGRGNLIVEYKEVSACAATLIEDSLYYVLCYYYNHVCAHVCSDNYKLFESRILDVSVTFNRS